jgi:hypothetical protein
MQPLFAVLTLVFAMQSVVLAQGNPTTWAGRVDWARLGEAFAAYAEYPSTANANVVRALLPVEHRRAEPSDSRGGSGG